MRLLHLDESGTLQVTSDLSSPPAYAILSHRWATEEDEVSFVDIQNGSGTAKIGMDKLRFCIEQAKQDGLTYVWVDTCCIDKRNQLENQKAITQMFKWYASAVHCYVYLADVSIHDNIERSLLALRRSQWFTRGWTLQELLAPPSLRFYSFEGACLGTREQHSALINQITGIDQRALTGTALDHFSEPERFEWAAYRHTTEPEDAAYCLLGIFGVTMLPHYGEGADNAFDRLKDEIVKRHRNSLARLPVGSKKYYLDTATIIRETQKRGDDAAIQNLRNTIISRIGYMSMAARRRIISHALTKTCGWILEHDMYKTWKSMVEQQDSFFWIKGHPGAGKSTLMKFLDYKLTEEVKDTPNIVISFYFNARGDYLDKSVIGLYRSLIVQLLRSDKHLEQVLDHYSTGREDLAAIRNFDDVPIPTFQELLAAIVARLGNRRLYCLVDALDETGEAEVLDMVYFLQSLREGRRISVLFASRHYPTLDIPTKLQLAIDHENGHKADIEEYISCKLHVGTNKQASEIRKDISSKANGVFMWVVLVIDILNREYRHGNILGVRRRLHELPQRLSDLLSEIVKQGDTSTDDFLLCLQWALFAKRPLKLSELYFAIQAGLQEECDLRWDPDEITLENMKHFIITYSKGLVEVTERSDSRRLVQTNTSNGTVQFIHESVREFFLDRGFSSIENKSGRVEPPHAHQRLLDCCVRALESGWAQYDYYHVKPELGQYADTNVTSSVYLEQSLYWKKEQLVYVDGVLPFMRYALEFVLEHAEAMDDAARQRSFCSSFDIREWSMWIPYVRSRVVHQKRLPVEQTRIETWQSACHTPKLCAILAQLNSSNEPVSEQAGRNAGSVHDSNATLPEYKLRASTPARASWQPRTNPYINEESPSPVDDDVPWLKQVADGGVQDGEEVKLDAIRESRGRFSRVFKKYVGHRSRPRDR